jgi:lipoprotein-anchoring transpeptidase ErfK/SrfK
MAGDSTMTRASGLKGDVLTGRLWRIAVLAAAGAIGATQADAALFYSSDTEPGFSHPATPVSPRRQKPRRNAGKKIAPPEKEAAKPQGPLIIAISIDQQRLKVYDANGFYAETAISTGMRGHPTPMGVFSIIQKHKLHHSNIYSGAPMPFMQRITWSGVAMHAGVLPGYPASHGCIRMPMAFASKMWNWTKMGARVVVTPGEMTPARFSHPLLAEQKVAPQPVAADEPKDNVKPDITGQKADKAADAGTAAKPGVAEASVQLRSSLGHGDAAKPVMSDPTAAAPLRQQTHTADASAALPASKASLTMSDAGKDSRDGAAIHENAPAVTADAANTDARPQTADSKAAWAQIKPPEATVSDTKSAETLAPATDEAVKADAAAGESAKSGETKADAKVDEPKTETAKVDAAETAEKPAEKASDSVAATTDAGLAAPDPKTTELKKDQARLPDVEKPVIAAAPKRSGQIAVFVSRKDGKLYVRQNLAPLFDVPVTIAPSERPLGTHVFTAQVDKDNSNLLRWSVVSLPVPAKFAPRDEDERASRRRKIAGGTVEMKPMPLPNSPAEALDRLTIPADAMARITDALTTGGSIVVSDQGIGAGETGEGTDFIVSLR